MRSSPFISVIVPVYKVEKYLNQCVDSILNQSFTNFELILVDDGSPDNCPQMCDEYSEKDVRVKVIHKENGGLSGARNAGIDFAVGKYTIFCDSDDYYCEKDYFAHLYAILKDRDIDMVFCRYNMLKNGNLTADKPFDLSQMKTLRDDSLINYLSRNDRIDSSAWSKCIRTEFLLENKLYFTQGMFSEDVEWMCRCLQYIKTADFLPDIAYCYRKRQGSITATINRKNVEDLFFSVETYADKIRQSDLQEQRKKACLNFISYQYFIILGLVVRSLNNSDKSEMLKRLKKYKWLCKYVESPKNKIAGFVVRFFGIRIGSFVFATYIKRKYRESTNNF